MQPLVHRLSVFLFVILFGLVPLIVKSQTIDYDQLKSMIDSLVSTDQFSGSIIVDVGSEKKIHYTAGYANRNPNIMLYGSTRFEIASLTKQFTAALILKLCEEGLLSLQDPFGKYLEWYPEEYKDQVSIHHLMAHQSGIPNYTNDSDWPELSTQDFAQTDFVAHFLKAKALEFDPGSDFSYSNSNYYLLGLIAEEVTKEKYGDLLYEYFFKPLEMNNSGTLENRNEIKNLALGYEKLASGYIDRAPAQSYSTAFSVSGLYSTPEDLLRWSKALDSSMISTDTTLNKMLTPYLADYGYGLLVSEINPNLLANRIRNPFAKNESPNSHTTRSIWHWGANPGYNTLFLKIPDQQLTIIILENLTKLSTDIPTIIPDIAQDIVTKVLTLKSSGNNSGNH
ncbi:CubicO group peptidase, beta-lactamase class C family [Cyclobacterium xiamenense]|uniref:CubicO group peptidase, beta-lactamase class C family n=1 Tax=Cyclobacterium xiamenense TaxID=1297121 RepID=A0A1H7C8K9_9BACT|nr:CubicO group peptidase, beta-lactamase class C family [Cyclobacterium xiamenense]